MGTHVGYLPDTLASFLEEIMEPNACDEKNNHKPYKCSAPMASALTESVGHWISMLILRKWHISGETLFGLLIFVITHGGQE